MQLSADEAEKAVRLQENVAAYIVKLSIMRVSASQLTKALEVKNQKLALLRWKLSTPHAAVSYREDEMWNIAEGVGAHAYYNRPLPDRHRTDGRPS